MLISLPVPDPIGSLLRMTIFGDDSEQPPFPEAIFPNDPRHPCRRRVKQDIMCRPRWNGARLFRRSTRELPVTPLGKTTRRSSLSFGFPLLEIAKGRMERSMDRGYTGSIGPPLRLVPKHRRSLSPQRRFFRYFKRTDPNEPLSDV